MRPRADRRPAYPRHRPQGERDRPAVVCPEQAARERVRIVDRLVRPLRRERGRVGAAPRHAPALRLDMSRLDEWIEIARDDMERAAHHSCLDHTPVDERARELLLAEPLEARPERDVRRRRVLRLHRHEPRDRFHDGHPPPLEQQLAREQRAVQLAQRQDARHARRTDLVSAPSSANASSAAASSRSART